MTPKEEDEEFYKSLFECTKAITFDCKTLAKLSNEKGRDDEIVESSVSAASHSSQLMEIVHSFVSRNSHKEDKRILFQSLQDSTKSVGTAVVEFIRAARVCCADWLLLVNLAAGRSSKSIRLADEAKT